jgi:soluble lytic murein transglycosylase-like protein
MLLPALVVPLLTVAGQQTIAPLSAPAVSTLQPALNPAAALEESLKKQRASLDRQRQAIHAQLGDKADTLTSSSPVEPFVAPLFVGNPANCPPIESGKLDELVSAAAQKQTLDPALIKAVIREESAFKPCAISAKGAQGLMQLMPATARDLHVNNAFDPAQNVHAGAAYLKQLLQRYKGDLRLALAAYNAGPGRADQESDTPLPLETQNYVANILSDLGLDQSTAPETQEDLAPPEDLETGGKPDNAPPQQP